MTSSRRALWIVAVVGVVAVAGAAWVLLRAPRGTAPAASPAAVRYHCPMHPTMVSDRPGDCPICSMRMVPIEDEGVMRGEPATGDAEATGIDATGAGEHAEHGQPAPPAGRKVVYRSTMNPNEVSDRPGVDSMGMEMVPVEVEEEPAAGATAIQGRTAVRIPARKQQLIGVTTSPVTRAAFSRAIRAVARVAADETRLRHIHTKTWGYVERLYANATGEVVREGEPLLEFYSPELLASQREYLLALRARDRMAGSESAADRQVGDELLDSARRRLGYFEMSDEQVRELDRTGEPRRLVTLYAPISGVILKRNVTQGERVEAGSTLLEIADLSRVWALASVYEYELPFVKLGQAAEMTLSYLPGKTLSGKVTLVYPTVDPATRTVEVRLEFANPGLLLKPAMYAEVALEADMGERLTVPDTAVIETGSRGIVFVDRGEGLFEPREVAIGLRLPDRYEILDGLREGERVVTAGNFLIDSESKLKAALAAMTDGAAPAAHQH